MTNKEKALAYPDAERFSAEDEAEEVMCDLKIRILAPVFRFC